ncbi:MAG: 4-hydroxy-2-oxovalerate aldolase [Myxococcales bacterium]|nr:4-hydroxy-2-oxovalerate aldolase [Myxococcales bacterium]
MPDILLIDPTLRDGNHAVRHQINAEQISAYCQAADAAGIPIVEVGHGNGVGASSLQVGLAKLSQEEMFRAARDHLTTTRLGTLIMPGFGTIKAHLQPAIDQGVEVMRVIAHCTAVDTSLRAIRYASQRVETYCCFGNSHLGSPEVLISEGRKIQEAGAQGLTLMDSAGAMLPSQVTLLISALVDALDIPIGFHAHNNLGMAIANTLAAAQAGATMVDACARGFGAGAGNAQLELVVGVLAREGFNTGVDLYKALDLGDLADTLLLTQARPTTDTVAIVAGLSGIFGGFTKHVLRISAQFGVDPRDVFFELGRRQVLGGQEDLILDVAADLARQRQSA